MALSTSKIARELDVIYKDLHELDFAIEVPKILDKKDSLQKEKHISVDPISLRESSMGEISFNMMLPPPPPLLPAKHKFLSYSLPNSATSSPRFGSRKKLESLALPRQVDKPVPSLTNNHIWRSKSCGDGRACAPSDEINDLWLYDASAFHYKKQITNTNVNNGGGHRRKSNEEMDRNDVNFKCNTLCLFLPGLIKVKHARVRKEQMVRKNNTNVHVISRAVSLEKFECGSWASSTIIQDCCG